MIEQEVFVLADQTLNDVVGKIADEQWDMRCRPALLVEGPVFGDDPKRSFATIVDRASGAVRDFDDLDRTVHTSFGDFSARDYLIQITSFRACVLTTSRG